MDKLPAVDAARRRRYLALAGVLLVLLAIAALAWWITGRDGAATGRRPVERLNDLPARPEDIEAHGAKARSVLAPADARARNAAVPFVSGPIAIARPFAFSGSDRDRAHALECLATAALYEAGDDTLGEAAVAQVILNRVRHPAFPATICGVVYQGSQRATGCQFTFTCDGSLRRRWPEAAWVRARTVADRALSGRVDASVGLATHYHTDWVYPYWSPELNKLARVGTHLFFGWPGSWGGPGAFRQAYRGNETGAALAAAALPEVADSRVDLDLGPAKILGLPQPPAQLPTGIGKAALHGNRLRLTGIDGRSFGLLAAPGAGASSLVAAAQALCAKPGPCQVSAWLNEDDIPGEYPIPLDSRGLMVFEYVRGKAGKGAARFDCERFPGKTCLPASRQPAVLSGIRWKGQGE